MKEPLTHFVLLVAVAKGDTLPGRGGRYSELGVKVCHRRS